jgi:hypothetical protein
MDSILNNIFRINHEHNTIEFVTARLGIVKCALTLLERTEDQRMIVILQIYIKCVDKSRKITIDNKNYINAVSSSIVTHLGLKSILYHKSYSISNHIVNHIHVPSFSRIEISSSLDYLQDLTIKARKNSVKGKGIYTISPSEFVKKSQGRLLCPV